MEHEYTFIEDNGGGLYVFVFYGDQCVAGIENLEYASEGEWASVKAGLKENPLAEVGGWEGHLDDPEKTYARLTERGYGYEVVADSHGMYPLRMGRAASRYFGVILE